MKLRNQLNNDDCLICCLEAVTDIPYENIPRFYENYGIGNWEKLLDDWLTQQGFIRIIIDVTLDDNKQFNAPTVRLSSLVFIAILQKKDRCHSHAVLVNHSGGEYAIIDPLKRSDYVLEDIIQIYLICHK